MTLLERDGELGELERGLAAAQSGDGSLLLLQGPAGIGKTALLTQARTRAELAGLTVLRARASELEREFPYGIVRQLLESTVQAASAPRRRKLLAGAAGLAAPLTLGGEIGTAAPIDPGFGLIHGLYWLVANLSAESPVALIVDDAHWADTVSLRFLVYLARRLDGLALTMLVSIRTGDEAGGSVLAGELAGGPGVQVITPAPLSGDAVESLLARAFGEQPDAAFARACRRVTGGNPFLIIELAAALIADGIEPTASSAAAVASLGPKTVGRAALTRLGQLSAEAVAMAQAIAVLGSDARLPLAAALAGLDEGQALEALDRLVAADFVPARGELEFHHPIVRNAIYNELAPGVCSAMHRRTADLLAAEGADLDAIASHLLLSQPVGSNATVTTLREAASHALRLGAPDSATRYLTRALDEGGEGTVRSTVLLELALAELVAHHPTAIEHLEQVRSTAADPDMRATAAIEEAVSLVYSGEWERPLALLDGVIDGVGEIEPSLSLRATASRTGITAYDTRLVSDLEPRLPALHDVALAGGAAARPLAMILAGVGSARGEPTDWVCALAERGWDEGRLLDDNAGHELLPQGVYALIASEELDRADAITSSLRDDAGARGSLLRFLMASTFAAGIETKRGNLTVAAGELRAACEGALEHGIFFAIPTLLWSAVDVLLERPDVADLAALAETIDLGPMAEVFNGALVLVVRGQLRFAAGERAAGIDDLRGAGAIVNALNVSNPNLVAWRSTLARMLPERDRAEACELATAELADARRIGTARGIGVALRVLGSVEADGLGRLEESVAVLADSPARLEHARTLIDLGSAMRRQGNRAAARDPLGRGLDLAVRCGATRLTEHARTELAATGARPRRLYHANRDVLTPSELRVARLAAEGHASQEIAEMLFVTTKTIDAHLHHTYAKLGINSRRQLAAALLELGS